ncbi:Os01g0173701 [Oryza sativa Japonica Group]|uniref:Os01g0173701 protein n=1 Tax=Oryza sativa subsp. japonica TaxID=39947 RepID=A0A0P0UYV8_ORYSJ|nr:Os01g0173701 [Oryza sativa Japonica Group]
MRASWRRGGGGGGCHAGGEAKGDGVGERGGTRRRGRRSARRLFSLRFLLVWVGRSAGGLGRKGRGWGDGLLELLRLQLVDEAGGEVWLPEPFQLSAPLPS